MDLYGLARAIPRGAELPTWARHGSEPWTASGHRLLVRLFDADGQVRSVRARAVIETAKPKALPPRGYAIGGLAMSSTLGVALLRQGRPVYWPSDADVRVVVAEGETDFLTYATRPVRYLPHATVGIYSGSIPVLDGLPDGCAVYVSMDPDEAGARYASQALSTLASRIRTGAMRLEIPDYFDITHGKVVLRARCE